MILKDSHITVDANKGAVLPIGASQVSGAQTFLTTSEYTLDALTIRAALDHGHGTTGTFNVNLYAVDGNHKPTGSSLASASKPISHFTDSKKISYYTKDHQNSTVKDYTFNFDSPYTVANATTYALVFTITGGDSCVWLEIDHPSGYTNGKLWSGNFTGTVFDYERENQDIYFKLYSKYALINNYESGSENTVSLGGVYHGAQTFTVVNLLERIFLLLRFIVVIYQLPEQIGLILYLIFRLS